MLQNLKITNYRLFENFELPMLTGVNLIVGANNSGKSSLLEAIYLLASEDARSSLLFLLHERGEYVLAGFGQDGGGYQISHIFHRQQQKIGRVIEISTQSPQYVRLEISLLESGEIDIANTHQQQLLPFDEVGTELIQQEGGQLIFSHSGRDKKVSLPVDTEGLIPARISHAGRRRAITRYKHTKLITANYMDYNELSMLWDEITLTPKEDKVVEALQILEPAVKRISFTSNRTSNNGILLQLEGQNEPIPLGSMGDGMRRILAIIASLVNVSGGILLVDEIDTGLHYATLKDMWRLILETAHKQKVQLFATTHSWDCVKAFKQALEEFHTPEFGQLLRLDKVDDHIKTTSYLAGELNIAIEQGIEVR